MKSRTVAIVNCASCDRCAVHDYEGSPGLGVHARPAAKICTFGRRHEGQLRLFRDGIAISAESIMGLLMMALVPRQLVSVEADGPDGGDLLEDFARMLVHGLGEPLCPDFLHFCEAKLGSGEFPIASVNALILLEAYAEHIAGNPTCIRGRRIEDGLGWS